MKRCQESAETSCVVGDESDNVSGHAWTNKRGCFWLPLDSHLHKDGIKVWSHDKNAWVKVSGQDLQEEAGCQGSKTKPETWHAYSWSSYGNVNKTEEEGDVPEWD